MPSIWTRQFPNPSSRALRWFLLVSFGVIVFIVFAVPFLFGVCKWTFHRSVTTYGVTIKMPFRWVVDDSESMVTFERPESFVFTGIGGDSTLTIEKYDGPPRDGNAQLWQLWSKIHDISHDTPPARLDTIHHPGVVCIRGVIPNIGTNETCVSDDATWLFQYRGSDAEFLEAQAIMWNILAQSPPLPASSGVAPSTDPASAHRSPAPPR